MGEEYLPVKRKKIEEMFNKIQEGENVMGIYLPFNPKKKKKKEEGVKEYFEVEE